MRHGIFAIAALTVLMPAVVSAQDAKASEDPRVIFFRESDKKMNAAMARAKKELRAFWEHFASPASDESDFMVKYDVIDGDDAEYIWAVKLRRDKNGITGALIDDAVQVEGFKGGQRVSIREDRIVDWGYYKGPVMQGSYTTRVMPDQMSPEEAASFRRSLGW
jgi:uncharacterized protein YegJ (DUF2314 family)